MGGWPSFTRQGQGGKGDGRDRAEFSQGAVEILRLPQGEDDQAIGVDVPLRHAQDVLLRDLLNAVDIGLQAKYTTVIVDSNIGNLSGSLERC